LRLVEHLHRCPQVAGRGADGAISAPPRNAGLAAARVLARFKL
jgi:hypothetical protein